MSPANDRCPQAKEEDSAPLNDVDYVLVVAGNSDEENPYRKGSALQVRPASLSRKARRLLTCTMDRRISLATSFRVP